MNTTVYRAAFMGEVGGGGGGGGWEGTGSTCPP